MTEMKIGTLNMESMTDRRHELVGLMYRRKVKAMCLQVSCKMEGNKAKELGKGLKLFYVEKDRRRNRVGIVLDDKLKKGVLEVRIPSDESSG